ncbi:MAG: hypothetical protein GY777_20515 [Candidatus Brocadiaceae bacterium]|nr:hypothetical protein [Candidatus Brocadiaceae bacterium]
MNDLRESNEDLNLHLCEAKYEAILHGAQADCVRKENKSDGWRESFVPSKTSCPVAVILQKKN